MRFILCLLLTFCLCKNGGSQDRGIGVIFLSKSGPNRDNPKTDTLLIYHSPSLSASIIARHILTVTNGFWGYKLENETNVLKENSIEFGYEEYGIPIDSIGISRKWVRVIYGFDRTKLPMRGWVRWQDDKTDICLWAGFLQKVPLFFLDGKEKYCFYDNLNGKRLTLKLEPSQNEEYNYIMYAVKTVGEWMQVKVVTPGDYCDAPKQKRTHIVWIRYLSSNGRPLAWFYPRGC